MDVTIIEFSSRYAGEQFGGEWRGAHNGSS